MATQALNLDWTSILREIHQREATSGRPLSTQEMQELMKSKLAVEAERSSIEAYRSRTLEIQEDAAKAQAKAARIKGLTDLGTLAYVARDPIKKMAGKVGGLVGGEAAVGGMSGVAPTMTAVETAELFGGSAAAAETSASIAAFTPEAAAGTSALTTVGLPAVGAVGGRALGGMIGGETGETLGGIAGGAAMGFAVGGPAGALIGAGLGVGMEVLDEVSVICTELHRQGLLSSTVYAADSEYGKQLDWETFYGYKLIATPIARKMKTSPLLTKIVKMFALPVAYEMAHRTNISVRPSFIGSVLLSLGKPLCKSYFKFRLWKEAK